MGHRVTSDRRGHICPHYLTQSAYERKPHAARRMMALNSFTAGLTFTDMPDLCGPDDLSDCVVSLRKSIVEQHGGDRGWLSPLSDNGVRKLVKLAFYASLAPEEGRYPRFRMMSANVRAEDIRTAASFNCQVNNVETLRRLAPAAAATDSALLIIEEEGTLHCAGFVIVSDLDIGSSIGRPEIGQLGRSPSLTVRVEGPGRLRVSEAFDTLRLHAGKIQEVVSYRSVPQVQELWATLASKLADVTAKVHGEESRKYFASTMGLSQTIETAWSRVLASTIERFHGGAFVVLPAAEGPEKCDIHLKYRAQMPFGDDIGRFWQSCVMHARSLECDHGERDRAEREWCLRKARVSSNALVLAGMSSVDGCVVLDRRLQLVGFGGEIRIDSKELEAAPRKLRNIKTKQLTPESEVEKLGTRHRSAYRLARVHPGIIVFVISQDGDLRIFCSDDKDVFGFDRLHAWVHRYEAE